MHLSSLKWKSSKPNKRLWATISDHGDWELPCHKCNLTCFILDHNYTTCITYESNNKKNGLNSSFEIIKVHFWRGINKIYNYLHILSREQWELLRILLKHEQYRLSMGEKVTLLSLASTSHKPELLPVFPFLVYMWNNKKKWNASRGRDCCIHFVLFIVLP